MDHLFRKIGMLAHRESKIVEYRQVAEQAADLEHHAHFPACLVKLIVIQFVDYFSLKFHTAA